MYGNKIGGIDAGQIKEAQYRAEQNAMAGSEPHETAFQAAAHAFMMVNELHNRIEALAERLVGPQPANKTDGHKAPTPVSIFSALDAAAAEAKHRIVDAHSALSRIERAIG